MERATGSHLTKNYGIEIPSHKKVGKAQFMSAAPSPKYDTADDEEEEEEVLNFVSPMIFEQPSPTSYTKKDLHDSLKQMNYGRLFAAQATLSDFTKRFNASTVDKEEKTAMINDVLGYLDLDLSKVF
jgi:hypothetical protein